MSNTSLAFHIGSLFIHHYHLSHIMFLSYIIFSSVQFSSVQFSCSVVSKSLRPHESQHTRPPCPSPTPGVHSDSHPSSQWCHPAISSSVVPFSSCSQSLPASESFLRSQVFAWGGQSTGVSASASFPPKKYHGWSPLVEVKLPSQNKPKFGAEGSLLLSSNNIHFITNHQLWH